MARYQRLIRDHVPDLARLISLECGKTQADADVDVHAGLANVERLCNISSLLKSEIVTEVSRGMDLTTFR